MTNNKQIAQEEYYKYVNFNLEAEPIPDVYSESDDNDQTASKNTIIFADVS